MSSSSTQTKTKTGVFSRARKPDTDKDPNVGEGQVRRSISIRLIRHGESMNNQVYHDARRIYKGGTPEFDLKGWLKYVDERRVADPGLSDIGKVQAERLAGYLEPHLKNQSSKPVRFIISPMRRTIETILPTLKALDAESRNVLINAFYFESEGCHTREKVEPGMNANEINSSLLHPVGVENASFEGFPLGPEYGWYSNGTGPETRPESEERAAKFYVWLMEYLDQQLEEQVDDIYDAGVTNPGEEHEKCADKLAIRTRKRRTAILIGHGDFMSLVLKRIVSCFGHSVEKEAVPHRSAFVHNNTGITELEYFGNGRFLIMSQNSVPHLSDPDGMNYMTGGSLKDGWTYLMPTDGALDSEVSIAFSDEVQPHVQEQTEALRSLYLDSQTDESNSDTGNEISIVVKRGLQVVGCATLDKKTGRLRDLVVRPSARRSQVGKSLIEAVKEHAKKADLDKIVAAPNTSEGEQFFTKMGFDKDNDQYAWSVKNNCKL